MSGSRQDVVPSVHLPKSRLPMHPHNDRTPLRPRFATSHPQCDQK